MKNRNRATRIDLLWAITLGAAVLWAAGCSKAVEQKNSLNNAFKPNIRQAQAGKVSSVAQDDSAPSPEQYSAAEYERLGDLSFKRRDLEAAFTNYEKALRVSPRDQAVRCKRAWVLVAGNFNSDAASEFEAILAKKDNNAGAREGLGQAYFQMKKYDQAAEEFKKALALDAALWRCRNYLGIIADHKQQPRQAIEEFKAALALKPDSGILYNNLGLAYSLAGVYDEAAAAYRRALELDGPRQKTLNNLGIALAKLGRAEEARAAFRQAGGEARANNNIGCVFLAQGDYESATKSFDAARRSGTGQ